MFDIITFGSTTKDIYLIFKKLPLINKKSAKEGLFFSTGSKTNVEKILFRIGGGGTNTATTFANQGFNVAWCGSIGCDDTGRDLLSKLNELNIDTSLAVSLCGKPTNHSVILTAPGKDRTIMAYRGASGELSNDNIPYKNLKSKWFYIAPLSGQTANDFESIVDYGRENNIKIFANPSMMQLKLPRIKSILKKIDILSLNQDEAKYLTKIKTNNPEKIFDELIKHGPGVVIMTMGKDGVMVYNGENIYYAKPPKVKVIDNTGAGDAFGSGFLAKYIKTGEIEDSIVFGMANASSCLREWGAKVGLLEKQIIKVKKLECK